MSAINVLGLGAFERIIGPRPFRRNHSEDAMDLWRREVKGIAYKLQDLHLQLSGLGELAIARLRQG